MEQTFGDMVCAVQIGVVWDGRVVHIVGRAKNVVHDAVAVHVARSFHLHTCHLASPWTAVVVVVGALGGGGELVARINLCCSFGGEVKRRADVAHVGSAERHIGLDAFDGTCVHRDVVVCRTVQCQSRVHHHLIAHEADDATVGAHSRVVGLADREGFDQSASAVLLQEQLEGAEIGAGFDVFAEGQDQVITQAHGGSVGHHVAAGHRDEVAVGAEVNRAVGRAQTRGDVTVQVRHWLMHHRLWVGVRLQDHLIASTVGQRIFGVDVDCLVV